ncbi:MAG: aminotransferase class I/II-fold pyridoxal phosphate-dependent enzyme [Porphyromonadaceae bacterium]|nr:aminotransferase class I/II-fold pyridoxal phosphate-dependent enzyme [Porphyromonadaceae bacterium]
MVNGHGDDLYKYPHIKANFSSNVYSDTDNRALLQHLEQCIPSVLGSYPEPEPYTLQAELAQHLGLSPDEVLVTNGATEAIYLIAQAFPSTRTSFVEPTFREYRDASLIMGHSVVDFDAHSIGALQVIWLCSPNNPTGQIVETETNWIKEHPNTLFVVDRSYEYFSRKHLTDELCTRNAIYIHSLTKRYRIPGLRLGYITGHAETLKRIRNIRQPWSVNALAVEAGLWIVRHGLPETIERSELWAETDRLTRAIGAIEGYEVSRTDTHFMLMRTPHRADLLKDWLARRHHLLVRDASNFYTLTTNHIRIATQTPEANDCLIEALRSYPGDEEIEFSRLD